MKLTDYFQLTIQDRIAMAKPKPKPIQKEVVTMETYYNTSDSISLLDYIRAYQLSTILGKYKLF